jgi:hypothetical protein
MADVDLDFRPVAAVSFVGYVRRAALRRRYAVRTLRTRGGPGQCSIQNQSGGAASYFGHTPSGPAAGGPGGQARVTRTT